MTWIPIIGAVATLIGAGLVAIISLIGAGLSFFFYWKSRTSSYKEILYSQQIEGCRALIEPIHEVTWLLWKKENINEDNTKDIEKEIDTNKFKYLKEFMKWNFIFSKDLLDVSRKFIILVSKGNLSYENVNEIKVNLLETAYKEFGVQPLTQETKDLLTQLVSTTPIKKDNNKTHKDKD